MIREYVAPKVLMMETSLRDYFNLSSNCLFFDLDVHLRI